MNDQTVERAEYQHCTFANVSFLRTKIRSSLFSDCVFIECYFRKSDLKGSRFVGCKFINCNFSHCVISTSDFKYAEFRGTAAPYKEMQHSAPSEPNLRAELFSSLSTAASSAGDARDSRDYRLAAIDAENQHLRAAVRADSAWYREHFPVSRRIGACALLFWHTLNRYLWRHGESAWRLLASALLSVLVIFPGLLWLNRSGLSLNADAPSMIEILWLSASNFLLLDRLSEVVLDSGNVLAISAIESLVGVIFAGMYVTLLIKGLLRR